MNTLKRSTKIRCFLATFFFLLAGLAGFRGTANAIPPPPCPGPDCQKVITIYNNNTSGSIYAVIQAGIQNPDPWLQALFSDNTHSYAETHYSRVYVNPMSGIPHGSHVSVTVPWYSRLQNDTDQYADWFNGCRIFIFDTRPALDAAHDADINHPLTVTADSPAFSCDACEPLNMYADTLAFPAETIPFQLLEYTFANVDTTGPPFIIDLNVGYNISYLDQIYLPIALTACRAEATCHQGQDPTARGYLGTTKDLTDFRNILGHFSETEGWVQYDSTLDDVKNRPRLPGTFNVLVDRVNVVEKHQPSHFTKFKPEGSVADLIKQWSTCTANTANEVNCPQFLTYQEIDQYFKENYNNYRTNGNETDCPNYHDPNYYPVPATLSSLNIMPYVYGWVPFNSGCNAGFNGLKDSPGPLARFQQALLDYIHKLEYNYQSVRRKKQRFNPFVDLVHAKLDANGYAFSVDDAVSFENQPGEGLIIAIGGDTGLPNPHPVVPPPNYTVDFAVNLGDSKPLNRPRWKSFGVCKDVADTDFPPLAPNVPDTPQIIVDTVANNISPANPCKITIKDASNRMFQFTVKKAVPWPAHTPPGVDSSVMTCINPHDGWCSQINENSQPGSDPHFDLFTPPPPPLPGGRRH
jgi:hypothetical protein